MKALIAHRSLTARGAPALMLCALLAAPLAAPSAAERTPTPEELAQARNADRLLIVDCLLPGQVRRLGAKVTFLTQRRPVKTDADDCAIRGGEYVSYDRADLRTALNVWLPGAQEGDKQAQTYVGEIYERGVGGAPPDYAAAAGWYQKAAEQGHARALINLGFLYERGLGVTKDPVRALNFYRKASGLEGLIALDGGGAIGAAARDNEENRALRRELEETRQRLEKASQELERHKAVHQSELRELESRKEQAKASGDLEATRKFEAQLRERESELARQRQEVARLESLAEGYRNQLKGAATESATLRQDLEQAREQLAKSAKELEGRRAAALEDQRRLDAVKAELDKARQQSTSQVEKERIKQLEAQLKSREEELARQSREIARVEQEARRHKEQLAGLETQRQAPAANKAKDAIVAIAPPSIELIDPPVVLVRSPTTVKIRGAVITREIVGKVTAPAGLLSFTVNDRSEAVDEKGLFKSTVRLGKSATPVNLVAVDARGRRAVLDFTLVQEGQANEQPKKVVTEGLDFGTYHALVIGNANYRHLPRLDTAAEDAKVVAELLSKKYGFKVTLLTNATRYETLSELNKLRAKLTERDNLLIYYAGHGELDRANVRGHWLPIDAEQASDANWISSVAITDLLNAMSVKHALVVADSCYSGAMTRSSIGQLESGMTDEARINWLKALARTRARTVLTSGGLQPVMDGGGGRHSVFAKSFLQVLQDNQEPLEGQRLYREVAARVLHYATQFKMEQTPEYAPLKFAGHESGDFIFVPVGL